MKNQKYKVLIGSILFSIILSSSSLKSPKELILYTDSTHFILKENDFVINFLVNTGGTIDILNDHKFETIQKLRIDSVLYNYNGKTVSFMPNLYISSNFTKSMKYIYPVLPSGEIAFLKKHTMDIIDVSKYNSP